MSSMRHSLVPVEVFRCKGNVWVANRHPKDTRTHRGVIEGATMGRNEGRMTDKGARIGAIINDFIAMVKTWICFICNVCSRE